MWHEITFQNIVEYFPEVINLTESDFNLAYQNSGYVDGDVFSMWESNMDDFDKIEIIMELEKLCNFSMRDEVGDFLLENGIQFLIQYWRDDRINHIIE